MRFVVIKKFKMSFKVVWLTVCECSGWFGVVICGLGTIAYCRAITFIIDHAVRHFYLVFYPCMVITKYKMRLNGMSVFGGGLGWFGGGLGWFGMVWGVSMDPVRLGLLPTTGEYEKLTEKRYWFSRLREIDRK